MTKQLNIIGLLHDFEVGGTHDGEYDEETEDRESRSGQLGVSSHRHDTHTGLPGHGQTEQGVVVVNVGELRDQREGLVQLPGEGLAGMAVLGQPGRRSTLSNLNPTTSNDLVIIFMQCLR